ncbi:hypothetical protein [Nocardia fluminea]|uniref:hypothetical protein n=1 Tax=Nocardia fluminea TaxID=134984 RepID=UPI0033E87008
MNTNNTGGQVGADDLNGDDAVTTRDNDKQTRGPNLEGTKGAATGARDGGQSDQSSDSDQDSSGDADNPNREAAKYRVRLREAEGRVTEAEAEVARLGGVVENLQKAAVESTLGNRITAKAFWASRGESGVSELLTDDGAVDSGKVAAAIDTAIQEFGLGPRRPEPNPHAGSNNNGSESGGRWIEAFSPRG